MSKRRKRRHGAPGRARVAGFAVAGLALVALWRVGAPRATEARPLGTGSHADGFAEPPAPEPVRRLADVLETETVGRKASIENVVVRELTTAVTFWAGEPTGNPVFVALEGRARQKPPALVPGMRVTLTGSIEVVPDAAVAARAWRLDATTASAVTSAGVYLRVTDIRTPTAEGLGRSD